MNIYIVEMSSICSLETLLVQVCDGERSFPIISTLCSVFLFFLLEGINRRQNLGKPETFVPRVKGFTDKQQPLAYCGG